MFMVHIIPHQPSFFKAHFTFFAFFCKLFFFTLQFFNFALLFRQKILDFQAVFPHFYSFCTAKAPGISRGLFGKNHFRVMRS